jgi:ribosomal protein L37AE/L43A
MSMRLIKNKRKKSCPLCGKNLRKEKGKYICDNCLAVFKGDTYSFLKLEDKNSESLGFCS